MTILDLAVLTILAIWIILTIFKNLPDRYMPSRLIGIMFSTWSTAFIPVWHFFAPNPGRHTFHLLYRDRLAHSKMDKWHEIHFDSGGKWFNIFWNPSKTVNKALIDIVIEFAQVIRAYADNKELIKISIPYLTILTFISNIPRLTIPNGTQFLIMQSSPDTGYQTVYLSDVHQL